MPPQSIAPRPGHAAAIGVGTGVTPKAAGLSAADADAWRSRPGRTELCFLD